MKECLFYTKLEGGAVRCALCPHSCLIKPGGRGLCRSRINRDGSLYSEAYGRPCALAIDPIEKKPLYHFHPGEECLSLACTGCNLRCKGCQNHDISQVKPTEANYYLLSPEELIATARKHRQDIIAFTYTEPLTWYEYTFDCAQLAHENGMKNVLVSAGYINEEPLRQIVPYIDAANIDLKYFNDQTYRRMSGASLRPILNTLKILRENNVHPCIHTPEGQGNSPQRRHSPRLSGQPSTIRKVAIYQKPCFQSLEGRLPMGRSIASKVWKERFHLLEANRLLSKGRNNRISTI